jgi:hypothetical protein
MLERLPFSHQGKDLIAVCRKIEPSRRISGAGYTLNFAFPKQGSFKSIPSDEVPQWIFLGTSFYFIIDCRVEDSAIADSCTDFSSP